MNRRPLMLLAAVMLFALLGLGQAQPSSAAVQRALLSPAGTWTTTSSLPAAFGHSPAVVHAKRVYLVGGEGPSGNIRTSVYFADLLDDGSLGAWQSSTPLPAGRHYHSVTKVKNYLYVIGGLPDSTSVIFAPIADDGTVGAWQTANALPAPRTGAIVGTYLGWIYVIGGDDGSAVQDTVFYARSRVDGSLTDWATTTALPEPLGFSDVTVANGYLYVAGGYTGSGYSAGVYSVAPNANGTLGSWNTLPSLPHAVGNHVILRSAPYMLVAGGWDGNASQRSVYGASILGAGSLGDWSQFPDLPQPLHDHAGTSHNNYVYVMGGYNNDVFAFQNTVYYNQFSFSCGAVTGIPPSECDALVGLYQNSDGANWTNSDGWLQSNQPCLWHGVTCANQAVQSLILNSNQLNGFIPAELGALTNLETLNLANNALSGALPAELSALTNLHTLLVDHNPLSGALPNGLSQLDQLDAFWFNNTNLCERPDPSFQAWLAALTNLQRTNIICPFPAAPTNLQATALNPTEIELQWNDNANNETGFYIFEGSTSFVVAPNTTTLRHSDLQPDSYHCYQMYAFNDQGSSDWTDFSCVTTPTVVPTVQLTATTFAADEAAGSATIQVILNPTSGQAVTVAYTTNDVTAAAGADYVAVNGVLQFAPGVGSQYIDIPITDDAIDEIYETLTLDLSAPTNAALGALASATLTIEDNDPEPAIHFANAATSVNEASSSAAIPVLLDAPSAKTVTVNYAMGAGTASAGSDYTASAGALTFAPGETSKTIPITILPDALDENNETVNISLSGPTNGVLAAPAIVVLTILDDDPPPSAHFSAVDFSVGENAASATITVALSAASALPITVDYATSNGSATAGSDYSPAAATLSFSPGDRNKTFSVAILDDAVDESNETVNLALTGANNATVGAPGNATLTIVDNDAPPPPVAAFSAAPLSGQQPLTVTFTDHSTGTVTSWMWDFGDGATSTTQNPTHLYQNVGVHTVTLTASGPGGLDDEQKTNYITVTEPAAATPAPSLSIPTNLEAGAGTKLTLPISYAGAGHPISSLLFSLQYDQAKLHFNLNDASAVQFSAALPASAIKSVSPGAADGELDVTIADFSATPQPLANGVILSITLDVDASLTPGEAVPLTFGQSSFGAQSGDIDGEVNAGAVTVIAMPDSIALSAAPTALVADGSSTSTITAVVRDAQGNLLVNRLVSFGASAGAITSQAATNANGVATAILTAATTVGPATVTATSGAASGQATVQFTPGEVAVVAPSASVASIPADGVSSARITVLVKDAFAHPIPNQTVDFATDLGSIPATAQTNGQGQAVATLTSVATVGTATITARVGAIQQTLTVRFAGSALSGVVYLDQNHNGVRDSGEAGLANVAVTIGLQGAGPTEDTSTGSDGSYRFDDLPAGNYVVTIEPPIGLLMTTAQSFTVTISATDATAPASGAAPPANPLVFLPLINR